MPRNYFHETFTDGRIIAWSTGRLHSKHATGFTRVEDKMRKVPDVAGFWVVVGFI